MMPTPAWSFLRLHLQNVLMSSPFLLTFMALVFLTGAIFPLIVAFTVAAIVHLVFQLCVNGLSAVSPHDAVLITGCSSGLGESSALHLASVGYTVFATVRKREDGEALRSKAGKDAAERLLPLLMDATQQETVDAAVRTVQERLHESRLTLRAVINNAGSVGYVGPLELMSVPKLEAVLAVNVAGSVRVSAAFLPLLRATAARRQTARLIFVTSVAGGLVPPLMAPFAASKFALEAAADGFRMELLHSGVDVCVAQVGQMDKPDITANLAKLRPSLREMLTTCPRADPAVVRRYDASLDRLFEFRRTHLSKQPAELVDLLHELAIRSRYPQARYVCGWDAMVCLGVVKHLPETLRDRVMLLSV